MPKTNNPDASEAAADLVPVEQLLAAKKTPDWLFAATKAGQRWATGHLLTEAAYDAAIEATGKFTFSTP